MSLVVRPLDLSLTIHQDAETPGLFLVRNAVLHMDGGCIGPARVFKRKDAVVLDRMQQCDRFFEFGVGLTRKADDNVGRQTDLPLRSLHPGDAFHVFVACIFPKHCSKYAA